MEQGVTQWWRPMASSKALNLLHQVRLCESLQYVCLAIEMAHNGVAQFPIDDFWS
jgi:hypothetical protein